MPNGRATTTPRGAVVSGELTLVDLVAGVQGHPASVGVVEVPKGARVARLDAQLAGRLAPRRVQRFARLVGALCERVCRSVEGGAEGHPQRRRPEEVGAVEAFKGAVGVVNLE